MLKLIAAILITFPLLVFGQDLPDDAESALKAYVKMREGYKRSTTKQFSRTEQYEMDDWCFAMEKKFPDAWQTDYAWFLNGHYFTNLNKLKEAYTKAPNEKRLVKAMFGYYAMMGEQSKQKELAAKVSKYYSANVLNYFEDVLPPSGVIIVSTEKEAIPLYILQLVEGKGKNITIVNMDYLINDDYRLRMADHLGTGSAKFFGSEKTFIQTALSTKNVYLSSTVSQSYIASMGNNAYLVGLYYQAFITDQKQKLESFWLNVGPKNFASMSLTTYEKNLYSNYLPPLMTLYKMKLAVGNEDQELKKAIDLLASKVEQTKTVNKIMTAYETE